MATTFLAFLLLVGYFFSIKKKEKNLWNFHRFFFVVVAGYFIRPSRMGAAFCIGTMAFCRPLYIAIKKVWELTL